MIILISLISFSHARWRRLAEDCRSVLLWVERQYPMGECGRSVHFGHGRATFGHGRIEALYFRWNRLLLAVVGRTRRANAKDGEAVGGERSTWVHPRWVVHERRGDCSLHGHDSAAGSGRQLSDRHLWKMWIPENWMADWSRDWKHDENIECARNRSWYCLWDKNLPTKIVPTRSNGWENVQI